jgi:GDSL-like Lipase/Acylhydrolase family
VIRRVGVALVLLVLAAACSSNHAVSNARPAQSAPPVKLLALGGSATEGDGVPDRLQDAWPYLVFREALPESSTFVNAATDDGRAVIALNEQVPLAAEIKPDIAAVWIGSDDVRAATALSDFRFAFTRVVDDLRAQGARRVLVGTIPTTFGAVGAYNDIIRSVARSQHAEVVELVNAPVHLTETDALAEQPDRASHRVIADAYERAIRRTP